MPFYKSGLNPNKIYIIAEIGLNHDGKINVAKKLIKDAKNAGADAVKFQIFEPETIGRDKMRKSEANSRWKRLFATDEQIKKLKDFSKKLKIDFICSVFDTKSLKRILKFNLKFIKIASSEVNNLQLLKQIKKTKIPSILSSGMSHDSEIRKAIKILGRPILLHCVSLYPCSPSKINLKRMVNLKNKYKLTTGFSDHTIGIDACKIAIMLGARVIEKHFTYDKKIKGSDHILSSDKKELSDLVKFSKNYLNFFGNGKISPSKKELKIQKLARKGIYFAKNLHKGHSITFSDLIFLRPENGTNINTFRSFINKKLNQNVFKFQSLKNSFFR